jgi:hypothetical protein
MHAFDEKINRILQKALLLNHIVNLYDIRMAIDTIFCISLKLHLDDVLYSLQETIPHLSRSSLHRCLKRHGCSVLPKKEASISASKKKFKQYPIGYFHIDIAEVMTAEGKLFVCSNR